jgi:hypothetical protein
VSAKCGQCWESVSDHPYEDEKQIAGKCDGYCGQWLCEDCAIREGGICASCKRGLAEP